MSEPVCHFCWRKVQIQKDCFHCCGTGLKYPSLEVRTKFYKRKDEERDNNENGF